MAWVTEDERDDVCRCLAGGLGQSNVSGSLIVESLLSAKARRCPLHSYKSMSSEFYPYECGQTLCVCHSDFCQPPRGSRVLSTHREWGARASMASEGRDWPGGHLLCQRQRLEQSPPPPPAPLDRVVTSHHQTGPLSSERLSVGLWSSVSPLVRRHPRSSQSNYKEVTGACTCNTYLATGLILWRSLEPCPTSYRPDLCSPF